MFKSGLQSRVTYIHFFDTIPYGLQLRAANNRVNTVHNEIPINYEILLTGMATPYVDPKVRLIHIVVCHVHRVSI